jgi:hypothetical protein
MGFGGNTCSGDNYQRQHDRWHKDVDPKAQSEQRAHQQTESGE